MAPELVATPQPEHAIGVNSGKARQKEKAETAAEAVDEYYYKIDIHRHTFTSLYSLFQYDTI